MTEERREQINKVYSAALEVETNERTSFIGQACADDAELRNEVESLLNGETLGDRLKRGPLPLDELLRTAIEIATALDEAHRKGEIYGDLNPDTILLSRRGAGALHRLCSVSLLAPSPALQAPSPPTGARELTLIVYSAQAPEQLEGREADARTDIFALGAVMYEMATGRKAFEAENETNLATVILTSEPAPMTAVQPKTPPELERLVKTCLAKDPEERWQTARDLVRELKWIAEAYPQSLSAKEALGREKKERVRWVLGAIFLLALGLGLGIWYHSLHRESVQTGLKRFVLPDGNVSFPADGFEISPDGQQLVIASAGFLWLRPVNSLNAQRLMGTGSSGGFCWLPDSRFVVVVKERKLLKVGLRGDAPQLICELPGSGFVGPPACNREGIVLFWTKTGIWKVSVDGGTPTQVTKLDGSHKEVHAFPRFLPDGRHFLYVVFRKNQLWAQLVGAENPAVGDIPKRPETSGIYVGSLDSKETKPLLDVEASAVYAQPGYLLYPRDGRLLAHPFETKRLSFIGNPIPIADDLLISAPANTAQFSVSDTGTLLYLGNSSMGWLRRQLTRVDRSGRKLETIGPPGAYYSLEVSPDGKQVALEQGRSDTVGADIWMMDLLDGQKTQITSSSAGKWDYVPRWAPDGRQIVFSSNRDQVDSSESGGNLYVNQIANGSGSEKPLLKNSQYKATSDSSPDGRYFLYQNVQSLPPNPLIVSLVLQPLFGERLPITLLESAMDGRFSPNGRWIAYSAIVPPDKNDIIVRAFPLARKKWRTSMRNGGQPLWRKDGKELFYLEQGDHGGYKLMAVEIKAGTGPGVTFEAGSPKALFDTYPWLREPSRYLYAASSDGQSFYVFTEEVQPPQVHVLLNWTELLPKK